MFSNTRGLEDLNKVTGWETRYQESRQRGVKKNIIESD